MSSDTRSGSPFYNSLRYCRCLEDFGSPFLLDDSSGYLLRRDVTGSTLADLVFPYPMFTVEDEGLLLRSLQGGRAAGMISATIISDPLSDFTPSADSWDLSVRWKTHLIVDNSKPSANAMSTKVLYYSRRASERFGFEVSFSREDRMSLIDDWLSLWGMLVERHGLQGLKALSVQYFRRLFELDEVFLAVLRNETGVHSIHIWIIDGDRAYSHLHASDAKAYECSANYLLYSEELLRLPEIGCRRCLLGSASGTGGDDGLFRFKKQFSNSTSENHLLGLVIDRKTYGDLTGSPTHDGGYFPSYRHGELL